VLHQGGTTAHSNYVTNFDAGYVYMYACVQVRMYVYCVYCVYVCAGLSFYLIISFWFINVKRFLLSEGFL
jgi:hypothetical protein